MSDARAASPSTSTALRGSMVMSNSDAPRSLRLWSIAALRATR
jgi:hypothetical protein